MDPLNEIITIEEETEISQDKLNESELPAAYLGDYSQEIYQYLLKEDFGGHFADLKKDTEKISSSLSSILAVLIFFVFLFFSFKFIRQKGLDL